MRFKEFLKMESFRTGAKLGLYAPLDDALGQYPPLYGMPRSADLITYIDIDFDGVENVPGKDGVIWYTGHRKHRPHPTKTPL